jgi:archaellum component FlaC
MALTLEDLDRRVAALEKGAEREKTIERAVAEIVSDSEQRLETRIKDSEQRIGARITDVELHIDRLDARIGGTERRFVDLLNERFDTVMVALDRIGSPPRD